jgi:hypothetical protein
LATAHAPYPAMDRGTVATTLQLVPMVLMACVYVGGIVVGYLSSVIYSSACDAVSSPDQPMATLLVNIGMTLGIWLGIALAWCLTPWAPQGSIVGSIS